MKALKNIKKYAVCLADNVRVASYANTKNGNYDVVSFKAFRNFGTREEAREYKRNYSGNTLSIINTHTHQLVR